MNQETKKNNENVHKSKGEIWVKMSQMWKIETFSLGQIKFQSHGIQEKKKKATVIKHF